MNFIDQVIDKRKNWISISGVIIVLTLIMFLIRGLNFGIDFTGGSILHFEIGEEFETQEIREVLQNHGLEDSVIQKAGGEGEESEVVIRTVSLDEDERNEIFNSMQQVWPQMTEDSILRSDNVGGVIGAELRQQAIIALSIAVVAIILYITFRFEFNFAVSAIIALINDVFFVLLLFSIFQFEIETAFVAALLTIMGYSINDTIVIFDRIRENLNLYKNYKKEEVVKMSLKRTLTRSINTSFTTLIVLGSLFIFGGITIRPFVAALLFGVIIGTYSSIFLAPNVWLILQDRLGSKKKFNASSHSEA
ncbi:protein translocase subunit SecF [Natranaerofaba carboxydovora]|uniref:protein translocase subunit SecF n=1 Tax=Natranaerofaba carboxydovora TaxID=2742683 RepID=UPI001F13994B|nr:protein translocase subunit SecF [Natranaerofaba carboxydovora]UMZ73241.1 Protein export membrane protein [Natranaerofaba carboxydovora]